jgi:hypothetical protein
VLLDYFEQLLLKEFKSQLGIYFYACPYESHHYSGLQ